LSKVDSGVGPFRRAGPMKGSLMADSKSLRDRMSEHSGLVATVAIVLIGVALVVTFWPQEQTATEPKVWFYDLNTKQLVAMASDTLSPVAVDSGSKPAFSACAKASG